MERKGKTKFQFRKKKDFGTYTEIGPWFRFPMLKPGFGRTLTVLARLLLLLFFNTDHIFFTDVQPASYAMPLSTHNYSSTFQETSNLWNPFPDPDAGLPSDLYEIHKNQWLRSQYQLWLQKVQENKALVEQYYFQK